MNTEKKVEQAKKDGIYVKTPKGIKFYKPEELLFGFKKKIILFDYEGRRWYVPFYMYGIAWALTESELKK